MTDPTTIFDKDDVYALIGQAELLRGSGKSEMPRFFYELATKISLVLGDTEGAEKCRELMNRQPGHHA